MPLAHLFDHNVDRAIALGSSRRAVDVVTAQEDGSHRLEDDELLDRTAELGRVLFTHDDDLLEEGKTLSAILNGRSGISPEMAVRLSLAFDTTAESWLEQQIQYDLWQAEKKRGELNVEPLSPA